MSSNVPDQQDMIDVFLMFAEEYDYFYPLFRHGFSFGQIKGGIDKLIKNNTSEAVLRITHSYMLQYLFRYYDNTLFITVLRDDNKRTISILKKDINYFYMALASYGICTNIFYSRKQLACSIVEEYITSGLFNHTIYIFQLGNLIDPFLKSCPTSAVGFFGTFSTSFSDLFTHEKILTDNEKYLGYSVESYEYEIIPWSTVKPDPVIEDKISEDLIKRFNCDNNIDMITQEDILPKHFAEKNNIIILYENQKGNCYDKETLLQFMGESVVYGPYPKREYTYYKLITGEWIDQQGFDLIPRSKILQLQFMKKERIGSKFGISRLHGQEDEKIYTLIPVR